MTEHQTETEPLRVTPFSVIEALKRVQVLLARLHSFRAQATLQMPFQLLEMNSKGKSLTRSGAKRKKAARPNLGRKCRLSGEQGCSESMGADSS